MCERRTEKAALECIEVKYKAGSSPLCMKS
jgi:hypothetical protein